MCLTYFRRVEPEMKADGSQVSPADRAAERSLIDGLLKEFPDCGILAEEGGNIPDSGGGTWHIDPLDGTTAYLEGLAHWGPTVCLVQGGALVVGAFWMPRVHEFWYAERGNGAWLDETLLRNPDPQGISRHDAFMVPSRFHLASGFSWPGKVRALGCSAAHLSQVACGGAIAALVPRWAMWDVGCGILLIEEAGRKVVDLRGRPLDPVATPGVPFLAGAPIALARLREDNAEAFSRRSRPPRSTPT